MKRYLSHTLLIATCAVATHALAIDLNQVTDTLNSAANTANAVKNTKDSIEGKNERFSEADRKAYKEYYNKEQHSQHHDDDDRNSKQNKMKKDLPPGLQKKVASGKELPPGWQKKVEAGQVFSPDLRSYAKRSPYPSPKGTSTYILENKVVRVLDATNEILDVINN